MKKSASESKKKTFTTTCKNMRTYKKKVSFTIAIQHNGNKEFEKDLDLFIADYVQHHGYDAIDHVLNSAIVLLLRKNGLGQSFQRIFNKIETWAILTPSRGWITKKDKS